jgi:hypothetical protein
VTGWEAAVLISQQLATVGVVGVQAYYRARGIPPKPEDTTAGLDRSVEDHHAAVILSRESVP